MEKIENELLDVSYYMLSLIDSLIKKSENNFIKGKLTAEQYILLKKIAALKNKTKQIQNDILMKTFGSEKKEDELSDNNNVVIEFDEKIIDIDDPTTEELKQKIEIKKELEIDEFDDLTNMERPDEIVNDKNSIVLSDTDNNSMEVIKKKKQSGGSKTNKIIKKSGRKEKLVNILNNKPAEIVKSLAKDINIELRKNGKMISKVDLINKITKSKKLRNKMISKLKDTYSDSGF